MMSTMMDEETRCPEGVPERLWEGIRRYVLYGIRPGSFLEAFFSNDLYEVLARGDREAVAALVPMMRFVHSRCPAVCKGSPERYRTWMSRGGLEGGALGDVG
jgi:hypothetical protein